MGPAIVTGVVAILAILTNGVVTFLNSRNDRALMDQELELLKKLDPSTDTAKKLREVINARVTRWHRKAYKTPGGSHTQPLRVRSDASVPWLRAVLLAAVLTTIVSSIFTLGAQLLDSH